MSYRDELKDDRWKQKAKWIKIRDDNTCQRCYSGNKLEVHHIRYLPYTKLWNYPDNYLITLCRNCHQQETEDLKKLDDKIESMLTAGLFAIDVMSKFKVKF